MSRPSMKDRWRYTKECIFIFRMWLRGEQSLQWLEDELGRIRVKYRMLGWENEK